jgi:hypothetical protein
MRTRAKRFRHLAAPPVPKANRRGTNRGSRRTRICPTGGARVIEPGGWQRWRDNSPGSATPATPKAGAIRALDLVAFSSFGHASFPSLPFVEWIGNCGLGGGSRREAAPTVSQETSVQAGGTPALPRTAQGRRDAGAPTDRASPAGRRRSQNSALAGGGAGAPTASRSAAQRFGHLVAGGRSGPDTELLAPRHEARQPTLHLFASAEARDGTGTGSIR